MKTCLAIKSALVIVTGGFFGSILPSILAFWQLTRDDFNVSAFVLLCGALVGLYLMLQETVYLVRK